MCCTWLLSRVQLFETPWRSPWNSAGQNIGVSSCSLLQGIFPTQGSNPGLPHCRQILYCLSQQGSPRMQEWAAYRFSSRSSWSRNWTRVSCIAGGFLSAELPGKPCYTISDPKLPVILFQHCLKLQKRCKSSTENSYLAISQKPPFKFC